jgi:hypothetical protein
MPRLRSLTPDLPSPFLVATGSLAILIHFIAVIGHTLAVPSGPWPGPEPRYMAGPPLFAQLLDEHFAQGYLRAVQLSDSYHFTSNQPGAPGVYLEIRLRDSADEILTSLQFPDKDVNSWMRHRQGCFVSGLVPDRPIMPPAGEEVPAPGQEPRRVEIWELAGEQGLQLQEKEDHLIPRNRDVWGPTPWSMVVVRSYARYLCRAHGATSAEIVRHSRDVIPPAAFLNGRPPPAAFSDLVASYGKLPSE